jgi:hypothetical protein
VPGQLPPDLEAAVLSFVQLHGEAALRRALAAGHLFPEALGKLSRRALQHSADYYEDGLPHTVVIQSVPGAKDAHRKVEITLTTGTPDLLVRMP